MDIAGTKLFVKALNEEGVDLIFGYPGGYAVDIFDELYKQDDIEVVLPRHEQGLIHAAEGYARATGKVGVCLVTSGPGATNLVTGIADANYDSIPLVCFTGQVSTGLIGNDAFQEVDIVGITRNICKFGVTVRKREDLGRIIKEAFYIARTGKPGPVIIDLPKDIMLAIGDDNYPTDVNLRGYKPSNGVHSGQIKRAINCLGGAKRPLFLIGGGVNISGARAELTKLVEQTKIPVVSTIMGRGAVSTTSKYYIGNVGLHGCYAANQAISECDVLFSIGTRFNDRITGKISEFAKHAKIIHIDIDSASISRNIIVDIPIVADAKEAINKLLELAGEHDTKEWLQEIRTWEEEHPLHLHSSQELTPESILKYINKEFEEPIVVTDVGQHQMFTTQYLKMDKDTRLITSGGLGTMGFGFPAAIGAKLGCPERTVLCITGDGGFQMNLQELATAVVQELPIIICIFNNSYLGMVRQVQELFFDKRYSCTCLRYRKSCNKNCRDTNKACPPYSPDFVKLADSYGAKGYRVFNLDEMKEAFDAARQNEKTPTIIEFMIAKDDLVLPIVPAGNGLNEMMMDC